MKSIYILLTKTHTKVASLVRYFAKTSYNHCSLALNKELTDLYAFARPEQHGLLLGRLVKETKDRYTNGDRVHVESCVIEVLLTDEQYEMISSKISEIEQDDEYMYNFISALSYPFTKGMSVYKSYTCVEFVCAMLQIADSRLSDEACRYIPDDLYALYQDSVIFQGDLRNYMAPAKKDEHYYGALTFSLMFLNLIAAHKIVKRIMFSILFDML